MKITNKKDVENLIKIMVEESIEIQLYDNANENEIISIENVDGFIYTVSWEDTVNGTCGIYKLYLSELVDKIWENRKYINKNQF